MNLNPMALLNALPGALTQGLIWGIMAIGVYITYKVLDLADLTVDGTMCTGGAVFIMSTMAGCPLPLAMLLAVLAGMLAGMVTGLLHTLCGIPAILSGILTQLALYSVNLRIMGKANQAVNPKKYDLLITSNDVANKIKEFSLDNPALVVGILVVVVIALLYWFFGREMGCALRATGSNPNMSRAQGISTNFCKVLGLTISNGLVALSAALLAQYSGNVDVNTGRGAIVIGLAAVIIGGVLFAPLFHNFALKLLAVVFGAIIYFVVFQVVVWLGLKTDDMKMLTAVIVAIFLAVPFWKARYAQKHVKRGANNA